MKTWKRIVLHCSDSDFGSVPEIRSWHLERGWSDIGYHYVIDNGRIKSNFRLDSFDGSVEIGRLIDGDEFAEKNEVGAHAYGFNQDSIGVCLIGKDKFSARQMGSLISLISDLMKTFNIDPKNVIGHYELDPRKTCPNINMNYLRTIFELTYNT